MKRKADFITNSSSTSFVCWGLNKELYNLKKDEKLMERIYDFYTKNSKDKEILSFEDFIDPDNYEFMECVAELTSLKDYSTGQEGEYFMIGTHPEKMKEDQTLKQFKDEIISSLNKIGFELTEKDIEFISESWYDG